MSRRTNYYLILEASEQGPWIRYESGFFYACPEGNPCLEQNGEEFSRLKNAINWLGKELFKEEDVSNFQLMCESTDKIC